METEAIDRLFLELSQFTRATTAKEQALLEENARLRADVLALRCEEQPHMFTARMIAPAVTVHGGGKSIGAQYGDFAEPKPPTLRVTHAASRNGDLLIVAKPGQRHHHIIRALAALGCTLPIGENLGYEQGFMLSDGTFATRARAEEVARASGQLVGPMKGSILTSEDLW